MKILHYVFGLPPVYVGGLVHYAMDLAFGQAVQGNRIVLCIAGPTGQETPTVFETVTRRYYKEIRHTNIEIYRMKNAGLVAYGGIREPRAFMDEGEETAYIEFFRCCKPEVIHLHSMMGLQTSFMKAAKACDIPIVYTTHDYYGICANAILYRNNQICYEKDWTECAECCRREKSAARLCKEQSDGYRLLKKNYLYQKIAYSKHLLPLKRKIKDLLKREDPVQELGISMNEKKEYEQLRKKYTEMFSFVSLFHFNSQQSEEEYCQRLEKCNGYVIPVSAKTVQDRRRVKEYGKYLHIGYLGGNNPQKGYQQLFSAVERLWKNGSRDVTLQVYGNYETDAPYIEKNPPYDRNGIEEVFQKMDVLVVPSVWKETFGLVVLEALCHGVPVIVSPTVGAKDALGEACQKIKCGIICQYGIKLNDMFNSLYMSLEAIYENRTILMECNRNICNGKIETWQDHVLRMYEFYERAEKRDSL